MTYAELLAKVPNAETDAERRANRLRYLRDETLQIESDAKENDEQRARIEARRVRNADEMSVLLAEQRTHFDDTNTPDDGGGSVEDDDDDAA